MKLAIIKRDGLFAIHYSNDLFYIIIPNRLKIVVKLPFDNSSAFCGEMAQINRINNQINDDPAHS